MFFQWRYIIALLELCVKVWIGVGGVGQNPILTPGCPTTDQTGGI